MDLVCFSHLRWDFVYQRPQHILSRFAQSGRVFYIEEPHLNAESDGWSVATPKDNVSVIAFALKGDAASADFLERQQALLDRFFTEQKIADYALWYYTPMALLISGHLRPRLTVYDCMDELSAFKFAPPMLKMLERDLLEKADLVFTGGNSLYQAKKDLHANIHPFPSSIDKAHFSRAREAQAEPPDQAAIPHPRFGFYGVIDERFDARLIEEVASQKPDWQFVLIGPIVKIDPAALPRLPNIHYLGGKSYDELPRYLHGWDIALIPFLLNESTRFISPTKTPEYLASGKPVISNAIADVVTPYGDAGLVHISEGTAMFIRQGEAELARHDKSAWLERADAFLADMSWDATWRRMADLMNGQLQADNF